MEANDTYTVSNFGKGHEAYVKASSKKEALGTYLIISCGQLAVRKETI